VKIIFIQMYINDHIFPYIVYFWFLFKFNRELNLNYVTGKRKISDYGYYYLSCRTITFYDLFCHKNSIINASSDLLIKALNRFLQSSPLRFMISWIRTLDTWPHVKKNVCCPVCMIQDIKWPSIDGNCFWILLWKKFEGFSKLGYKWIKNRRKIDSKWAILNGSNSRSERPKN